jgi:hypothetical protein
MTYGQYITGFLNTLQAGSSIAVPQGVKITPLQLARSLGQDFELVMRFCDKMEFRGMLIPSLVADNSDKGAYAQSKVHFDTFVLGLDMLIQDVSEVILDQFIGRISI